MKNKHLIMGTAGHVDHGKTTLIKALTGFDCDTHKQEKERGITINLGFSHLDLPNGNSVGIVDVPGHADFIKTMVAGACGIDFVLLIVAADESVMPQTAEHLQIMQLLGINKGIIVLTKIDMVEPDLAELAVEDVRDFVQRSFLKDAPIIPVSSTTNEGIEKLINEISNLVENIPSRDASGVFRMYVDRVFTQEGFGTIMNGSVISGAINRNNPIYLLPGEKELRIRRLEHHGKEVEAVSAGDRASFNVVGFKQKDFRRGMLLSNQIIKPSKMIDVRLQLFQNEVGLELWSQVIFLLGTNRLMCRMHLLDQDYLNAGETGLAQIYLPTEIVCQIGDKFIIRNSSGNLTLGGGSVVDPYPLHHRRRRESQVEIVKKLSTGELNEIVAAEVRKKNLPISYNEIAEKLHLQPDDLIDVIFNELPGDIMFFQEKDNILLLLKKIATATQNKILSNLLEYHKKNPLKENGRTFKELMGIFGNNQNDETKLLLKLMLEILTSEGKIRERNNTWIHSSHQVKLDEETKKQIQEVDDYLKSIGNASADFNEIDEHLSSQISDKKLQQILAFLQEEQKIHFIQMRYMHDDFLQKARQVVIDFLKQNDEGIAVAQFRDMIGSNRANAILVLDWLDNAGITLRKGNFRFLTKKFLEK
ncbi:MAG: selenocysteine-specific translation elongation factor [Candidatus Cloacimonetes bacterium]|nr:selenocysteine-specific translation elongation factor [Candidatus Cloacimonadota bacterium]MCF7814699.1 selenocysteine-specific translation elongation factor [Candidatus Cloacimonadota bacterium]MCF7868180.1 selenocysteine-specific translation elongation factor [Candidatus Cloacimonadota bacterium]MCF7884468.1 selenocysteine-specific translation elongation factor [Candidatus Cloacimonadota bacterium]